MNKAMLIGNLTRDPEARWNNEMCIVTFTIAIDRPPRRDGTKETDYPRIRVFGKQAENCERYLKKGSKVGIEGQVQTGQYESNGETVYYTEVKADRVEFLTPKQKDNYGGGFDAPY